MGGFFVNAGETTCVKTRCVAACPISSSASQRGVVLTLNPDGTAASNSLEIIVHKALGRQESTILRSIVQQAVQIPRESLFRPPLFNFCSFSVTFFTIHLFCGPGLFSLETTGNFSTKAVSCHHFVLVLPTGFSCYVGATSTFYPYLTFIRKRAGRNFRVGIHQMDTVLCRRVVTRRYPA